MHKSDTPEKNFVKELKIEYTEALAYDVIHKNYSAYLNPVATNEVFIKMPNVWERDHTANSNSTVTNVRKLWTVYKFVVPKSWAFSKAHFNLDPDKTLNTERNEMVTYGCVINTTRTVPCRVKNVIDGTVTMETKTMPLTVGRIFWRLVVESIDGDTESIDDDETEPQGSVYTFTRPDIEP
jgi:hypothetical protein